MFSRRIDLNADVGEAVDETSLEVERALLGLVTSAHVACGGHTGDDASMEATVAAALEQSVRVGAHPSYPDRDGFGRRPMEIDVADLRASLREQLQSLVRICEAAGADVWSVKAHGALYEEVARGRAAYEALRDAMRDTLGDDTVLVLPSGCRATATALHDRIMAHEEGFCDRTYRRDGGLVQRGADGAVLCDPAMAAAQALSLARGAVVAEDGSVLTMWVDTLCVHGDAPGAVAIATAVRQQMAQAGIEVVAPARP